MTNHYLFTPISLIVLVLITFLITPVIEFILGGKIDWKDHFRAFVTLHCTNSLSLAIYRYLAISANITIRVNFTPLVLIALAISALLSILFIIWSHSWDAKIMNYLLDGITSLYVQLFILRLVYIIASIPVFIYKISILLLLTGLFTSGKFILILFGILVIVIKGSVFIL